MLLVATYLYYGYMIKILGLVIISILIISAFAFYRYIAPEKKEAKTNILTPVTSLKSKKVSTDSANLPVEETENETFDSSSFSPDTQDQRISILKQQLTVLQKRVEQLELSGSKSTATTTTQSASKVSTYVFSLGKGGSTVKNDWTTVDNLDITIDPSDYSGYKSMQLEVEVKVKDGNGKVFARLFNSSDGTSVSQSEISSSAFDYTWVTSSTFNLSSGKKTFKIQLKSLTGYEAFVQSARIKVNF